MMPVFNMSCLCSNVQMFNCFKDGSAIVLLGNFDAIDGHYYGNKIYYWKPLQDSYVSFIPVSHYKVVMLEQSALKNFGQTNQPHHLFFFFL